MKTTPVRSEALLAELQEELRKVTNAHIADRIWLAKIQLINRRAESFNSVIETMTVEALTADTVRRDVGKEPRTSPPPCSQSCSVCGKPCDDKYGFGPNEVHCSAECHDIAMRAHAGERMTPEERSLYDDIHKIATANASNQAEAGSR